LTPTTDTLSARIDDHDAAVIAAVDRLLDLAAELSEVLADVTRHDAERRAAAGQLGIPVRRRPAKELAAEIVLHAARDLRPCVAFTTAASAESAAEALRLPSCDLERPPRH
jgi:hypothetical protein